MENFRWDESLRDAMYHEDVHRFRELVHQAPYTMAATIPRFAQLSRASTVFPMGNAPAPALIRAAFEEIPGLEPTPQAVLFMHRTFPCLANDRKLEAFLDAGAVPTLAVVYEWGSPPARMLDSV